MIKTAPSFQLIQAGLLDYPSVLQWQRRLADERARGLIPDTLLLVEHPHTVTRGAGASGYSIGRTPHPIYDVERGGDVTYHGPGQLVGYPIVHLKELRLMIGPYLRLLEQILIDALAGFGIEAERQKGFTGVWSGGKKLASIGIAVRQWVAYHGFALNVSTDLAQFRGIHPCGLEPERMGSMQHLLGRAPAMDEVRQEIARSFRKSLDTVRDT